MLFCTHMCVCVCVCVYIYIHTHMCVCFCVLVCVCACVDAVQASPLMYMRVEGISSGFCV